MERLTKDDSIIFRTDSFEVAKFEDNGNGMEGFVTEGHKPIAQGGAPLFLSGSDMIALAAWLLTKAEERARDSEFRAENS